MTRYRITRIFSTAAILAICLVSFQNCSQPMDAAETVVPHLKSENGNWYEGKVFVEIAGSGVCADGMDSSAKIVVTSLVSAQLVRENCQFLSPPVNLDPSEFQFDPTNPDVVIYQNRIFTSPLSVEGYGALWLNDGNFRITQDMTPYPKTNTYIGSFVGPLVFVSHHGKNDASLAYKFAVSTGDALAISILNNTNVGIGTYNPTTKLQVAGEISPSVDGQFPLGNPTLRFTSVFTVNGVTQTSDAREKKDVENSALGLDFLKKLRPVSFRWKSGDDERRHYGLIAQETEQALRESQAEPDVIVTRDPAGDRYGLLYAELLAPVIKAIQQLSISSTGHDEEIRRLKRDNEALKSELKSLRDEMRRRFDDPKTR